MFFDDYIHRQQNHLRVGLHSLLLNCLTSWHGGNCNE